MTASCPDPDPAAEHQKPDSCSGDRAVRDLAPAEERAPAAAPVDTTPARGLRRKLVLLAVTLLVCCEAGLAAAAATSDAVRMSVPRPSPVASCHIRQARCGPIQRRAALNRAAAVAKLSTGTVFNAAQQGMRELLGLGDSHNPLRWNAGTGLWGGYTSYATSSRPSWWQSAIATWTLVRYLEATASTNGADQGVLDRIFELNVSKPGSRAPVNFANQYMDDTGWWALAWTEAARYELNIRGDQRLAARYLTVAEWDERYISRASRSCGGVVWKFGYPADTISNAEFAALSAELYAIRHAPGPLHNRAKAGRWLGEARWALSYLQSSGLVNLSAGTVRDGFTRGCRPHSGPFTYTEGEVADALIQMGVALHDQSYLVEARRFLDYTMSPASGMSRDGVLQERCEARRTMCHGLRQFDVSSFKGIFVQAVADYDLATRTHTYRPWLKTQADAIVAQAVSDGRRPMKCATPRGCQFGLYWSRDVRPSAAPVPSSLATQTSALQALTAALAG